MAKDISDSIKEFGVQKVREESSVLFKEMFL